MLSSFNKLQSQVRDHALELLVVELQSDELGHVGERRVMGPEKLLLERTILSQPIPANALAGVVPENQSFKSPAKTFSGRTAVMAFSGL